VQEYATLKGELASRYKEQRDLYTQAKSAFILQIINKSRLENAKH
jgi:GrpB-like predicted nucleotidyltransferase (UPF0157 family)